MELFKTDRFTINSNFLFNLDGEISQQVDPVFTRLTVNNEQLICFLSSHQTMRQFNMKDIRLENIVIWMDIDQRQTPFGSDSTKKNPTHRANRAASFTSDLEHKI